MTNKTKLLIPDPPDFISRYINYIGKSEAPVVFHRWSAIAGLGTWLSRNVWFQQGNFKVYPNLYVQLFGAAGTRKSTSIKQFSKILRAAGFKDFSLEKTSKEKFIEWLADRPKGEGLEAELWDVIDNTGDTNVLIAADEFNDFFSTNILDFLSFLGVMWDYEGEYTHATRSGGTVHVTNPNISILSGNTPTTLAATIPPEAIGQGFFSRVIIVHGEATGVRIAFPTAPSEEETQAIVEEFQKIKTIHQGRMTASPEGMELLEYIYSSWRGVDDPRFEGYGNRRFNQLLKLCIIHSLAAGSPEIELEHILRANTVLHRAEKDMPKALGEFGSSRTAAASYKVLQNLKTATKAMDMSELWARMHTDLDTIEDLSKVVRGLIAAGKINVVAAGFLPAIKAEELDRKDEDDPTLDWSYLTEQERVYRN